MEIDLQLLLFIIEIEKFLSAVVFFFLEPQSLHYTYRDTYCTWSSTLLLLRKLIRNSNARYSKYSPCRVILILEMS